MRLRLSFLAIVTGFGFLAAAVFNFFDHSQFTKTGPSVAQGILEGFGLLWLHIGYFLAAFAVLHAATGWAFAFLVEPLARRLGKDAREASRITLLLFLLGVIWIALEAAARFPHSMLGGSFHDLATDGPGWWLRIGTGIVVGLALATGAALRFLQWIHAIRRTPRMHAAAGATLIALLAGWTWLHGARTATFPNDPARPHVILVGIDGWRLDTLPANGGPPGLMPFVEEFMAEAAVIEEAYTPLARTFPAWWTVFTGQFPATHGARFNLIADEFIQTPPTLPAQLGERGYHRLFAMDEFRFANFRTEHGFDQVVGPGLGAADFLLGGLKDTPLSNLLVNTRIGGALFPFNHANRAAHFTYRPETFDRLLARTIDRAPRQPLFLVAHFELPHWPFSWADGPTGEFEPHPMGQDYAHYMETLRAADSQVGKLFATLQQAGVLDNAIVVLLSDHGEAFSEERLTWSAPEGNRRILTPAGHGNHVMGLTQYQIPLAFRRFGGAPLTPGVRPGRASLADIYPTLAEWLDLDLANPVDGQSLMAPINNPNHPIPDCPIALETGFNPGDIGDGTIDESRLLAEGAAYYRVLGDGRLVIKPNATYDLIAGKQRAVLYGDQFMAIMGSGATQAIHASIGSRTLLDAPTPGETTILVDPITAAFCGAFAADLDHIAAPMCRANGLVQADEGNRR